MKTSTVESDIGVLNVREEGHGPSVVFLHGLMTNSTVWDEVVQDLTQRARCVLLDLPMGAHRRPANPDADLSIPGIAAALAPVLARLCPEGYVLVASDTGGVVAQEMLCRHPGGIRAALLLPCDLYENFLPLSLRYLQAAAHVPGAMLAVRWALEVGVVRRLPIAFGWLTRRGLTPQLLRETIDPLRDPRIRRDLARLLQAIDPGITRATAALLPETEVSTFFLWSSEDRLFPVEDARRLAEAMGRRATFAQVEGAYSFIQIDRPARVVAAVEDVLDGSGPLVPENPALAVRPISSD
ncbi:MAG: alpha/beta hydrolase [Micrococcus sp.]|nr:alpha/beta hydrolase [Micrococcus sp.]